jgi:hypothetical protein
MATTKEWEREFTAAVYKRRCAHMHIPSLHGHDTRMEMKGHIRKWRCVHIPSLHAGSSAKSRKMDTSEMLSALTWAIRAAIDSLTQFHKPPSVAASMAIPTLLRSMLALTIPPYEWSQPLMFAANDALWLCSRLFQYQSFLSRQ